MPVYIQSVDETSVIASLIKKNGSEYHLFDLIDENYGILTKAPKFSYEFPCIVITKGSGLEEPTLGDISEGSPEVTQPTVITLNILTRKNICKIYNAKEYSNEGLVRLIRDVLKQIFFDFRDYEDTDFPKSKFIIDLLTSDIDDRGITSSETIFATTLTYSFTFVIDRSKV